jgi:hypothetical protein
MLAVSALRCPSSWVCLPPALKQTRRGQRLTDRHRTAERHPVLEAGNFVCVALGSSTFAAGQVKRQVSPEGA